MTRLPLTVSDLPIMLKGLWGDSNRNTECVASALRILTKKGENGWGGTRDPELFRRVVIQVLSEPSLDFVNVHIFALTVVGNLITLNLAETKIA